MKKLLNLLLTMVALVGISCEQQGGEGGNTPATFTVDVANITINNATVNVVPPSNETYLFDVVARLEYEEYATPADFAISRIAMLKGWADAQNRPLTELLVSGAQSREYDWLSADTKYYAYAFGVSADGELSTDVVMVLFKTEPYSNEPSNNTFDIKLSDITAYGAKIEVTPLGMPWALKATTETSPPIPVPLTCGPSTPSTLWTAALKRPGPPA